MGYICSNESLDKRTDPYLNSDQLMLQLHCCACVIVHTIVLFSFNADLLVFYLYLSGAVKINLTYLQDSVLLFSTYSCSLIASFTFSLCSCFAWRFFLDSHSQRKTNLWHNKRIKCFRDQDNTVVSQEWESCTKEWANKTSHHWELVRMTVTEG